MIPTASLCVSVVEGTVSCLQQPVCVCVCVCGRGHTRMFTTACHCVCECVCVCVVEGKIPCLQQHVTLPFLQQPVNVCMWWTAHYHVQNSLSMCVYDGGHPTMFTTACQFACVCVCVVGGTLPCSQQPVTVYVWWRANNHVHNSLLLCVCVCGELHTTKFTTACHSVCVCVYVVGGTLPCSQHSVTVCVWWRAEYHVHNSWSLCVCGEGHTTVFTTACHCVCVCVWWRADYHVHNSL